MNHINHQKIIFISSVNSFGGGEVFISNLSRLLENYCLYFAICNKELRNILILNGIPNENISYMVIDSRIDKIVFFWKVLLYAKKNKIKKCVFNSVVESMLIPIFKLAGFFSYSIIHTQEKMNPKGIRRYIVILGFLCSVKIVTVASHLTTVVPNLFQRKVFPILNRVGRDYISLEKIKIRRTIKTIIFIGRVSKSKGVQDILSVALLFPNINFKLIGQINAELDSADIKNPSNVTFLGFSTDVVGYLRKSDAIIFSSRSEGMPYAVIEAAAIGLPIIATKIEAHVEISKYIRGILLYEPGNIASLAELIINVSNEYNRKEQSMNLYEDSIIFNNVHTYRLAYINLFDLEK